MGSKYQRFIDALKNVSESKIVEISEDDNIWLEWEFKTVYEDESLTQGCICGKKHLKLITELKNNKNLKEIVVGCDCIEEYWANRKLAQKVSDGIKELKSKARKCITCNQPHRNRTTDKCNICKYTCKSCDAVIDSKYTICFKCKPCFTCKHKNSECICLKKCKTCDKRIKISFMYCYYCNIKK
jgi:hypothetical protein